MWARTCTRYGTVFAKALRGAKEFGLNTHRVIKQFNTVVDRERSSFYPQSHARRTTMYTIMPMNDKNDEGLGRGREKDDRGGFIVF